MTKLALPEASRLARLSGFSDAQIHLVRQTVAKNATNLELCWLLYNARRLDADPVLREIYLIKYDAKTLGQIVEGIALLRKRAEGSGHYAGTDLPQFEHADVGQPEGAPSVARVCVYTMNDHQRCPVWGEARWEEFFPEAGKKQYTARSEQWLKRPHNQLSVRAEAHALRRAFPRQTNVGHMEAPPEDWEAAAFEAEQQRSDPEQIRLNAAMYDRIFGEPDEQPRAEADAEVQE